MIRKARWMRVGDILRMEGGCIREEESDDLTWEQAQGFWRLYLSLCWPGQCQQCAQAQQMEAYGQRPGGGTSPKYEQGFEKIWSKKRKRERDGEPEVTITFDLVKVFNAQGRVWRRWAGSLL